MSSLSHNPPFLICNKLKKVGEGVYFSLDQVIANAITVVDNTDILSKQAGAKEFFLNITITETVISVTRSTAKNPGGLSSKPRLRPEIGGQCFFFSRMGSVFMEGGGGCKIDS